jgi:leader peptidase (prepilin peptidase)/N-methyltransferase
MYYIYISLVIFIIFFSALIIAIRTDLESMVIPQLCTLWLVPIGIIGAFFSFTGISFYESLSGALIGYGVLWLIAFIFKLCTKREGMGIGDMELLAMIGSFLGPWGVWFTLMISSFSGLAVGALYLVFTKQSTLTRIPFGPFLALGAFIYFFFEKNLIHFFLLH